MKRIHSFEMMLNDNPKGTSQMKGETVVKGRIHHYVKKSVAQLRAIYESHIKKQAAKIDHTFEGPLELEAKFYYMTKDKKKLKGEAWKTSRPDCDNIIKLLQDVLNLYKLLGKDDSYVTRLVVEKHWGVVPSIRVQIRELE